MSSQKKLRSIDIKLLDDLFEIKVQIIRDGGLVVRLITCYLSMVFLLGCVGVTNREDDIKISEFITSVLSEDCAIRHDAVSSLIQDADPAAILDLQKELEQRSPKAAIYVKDAIDFVQSMERAAVNAEAVTKDAIEFSTSRMGEEEEVADTVVSFLSRHVNSENSSVTQALLIGHMAGQAAHYGSEDEANPFLDALDNWMLGNDLRLRVFAAAALSVTEMETAVTLTPIILEGLGSDEFPVRYYSQYALQRHSQEICFNPLDPPAQRLPAMAAWQEWWWQQAGE